MAPPPRPQSAPLSSKQVWAALVFVWSGFCKSALWLCWAVLLILLLAMLSRFIGLDWLPSFFRLPRVDGLQLLYASGVLWLLTK